jgi:hypothetical protein
VNPTFIFINGINTLPTDQRGWTDRAVAWVRSQTDCQADSFEWFGGPLGAQLLAPLRTWQLLQRLRMHRDNHPAAPIILVGHSFGCELICRVLQRPTCPLIADVWLIAAACDASFRKNGLNRALATCQLNRVFCLQARRDGALALAKATSRHLRFLRWLGLDYGWLGLTGPQYVDVPSAVTTIRKPDRIGHTSWLTPDNLPATMQMIHAETQTEVFAQ